MGRGFSESDEEEQETVGGRQAEERQSQTEAGAYVACLCVE